MKNQKKVKKYKKRIKRSGQVSACSANKRQMKARKKKKKLGKRRAGGQLYISSPLNIQRDGWRDDLTDPNIDSGAAARTLCTHKRQLA